MNRKYVMKRILQVIIGLLALAGIVGVVWGVLRYTLPAQAEQNPAALVEVAPAANIEETGEALSPEAATYYFEQSQMGGLGTDAGTLFAPYLKAQTAIDNAVSGDTLIGLDGHYAVESVIDTPMLIQAYNTSNPVVLEPYPTLLGDTSCAWGSADCNRCANNVEDNFQYLGDYAEKLGFWLNGYPAPQFEVDWWDWWPPGPDAQFHGHWQGVQRIPGYSQWMLVTRDYIQDNPPDWEEYQDSGFVVVNMASRNANGYAYGSNLALGTNLPASNDQIVNLVRISEEHKHPGGIQTLGHFLVVGTGEVVQFYDVSNPLLMEERTEPVLGYLPDREGLSGSSVSLAKLQNGRYFLVTSASDACPVHFYISDEPESLLGTNPNPQFSIFDRIGHAYMGTTSQEWTCGDRLANEWDAYQNMSLVTDCQTGALYVVATGNRDSTATCFWQSAGYDFPCAYDGDDWADLYKVVMEDETSATMVRVASERFDYGGQNWFDASAGLYVDPAGRMYLYVTSYNSHDGYVDFWEYGPNVSHTPEGGGE